jgi:ubiquinone/menaquinone biosynthesis C-methylase UbiE
MPSVQQNLELWNQNYSWSDEGDEWSSAWGGTDWTWWTSLYPRVYPFLPAGTILEIAPGHGRFTKYLKESCERLIVVDLSPNCIEACQRRFAGDSHIEYHVNDGRSLAMVPDGSIDFVFSFDSLVHADAEVIQEYVRQIARKLTPRGWGFLHHSNLGSYRLNAALAGYANKAKPIGRMLTKAGLLVSPCWRAGDMTADLFDRYCRQHGLQCMSQELINWGNYQFLIDSISIFRAEHGARAVRKVIRNDGFMDEVERARLRAEALSSKSGVRRPATLESVSVGLESRSGAH